MRTVTVDAKTKAAAVKTCQKEYGWTPAEVRQVDSGKKWTKAYMCFESYRDADIWDAQK